MLISHKTLTMVAASRIPLLFLLPLVTAADFEYPDVLMERLAFGSCHKLKYARNSTSNIWNAIGQTNPQTFLWTGDAIYPPQRGIASVQLLETEYNKMKEHEGYRNFLQQRDVWGTWDDHDYGGNDVGHRMPQRHERAQLYWKFLDKEPLQRDGIYYSVSFGRPPQQVKIIFLDTRWFRKDHCIPSLAPLRWLPLGAGFACLLRWLSAGLWPQLCHEPTDAVLGPAQWEWLEHELENSSASVHLIVSSIQVLTTNPVMESWGHFPQEQDRLLQLLAPVAGVQILSGDVHHAELSSLHTSILEVTSSGLTHDCSTAVYGRVCRPLLATFDAHRWKSQAVYIGRNFGSLHIDWEQRDTTTNVHNETGSIVLSTGALPLDRQIGTDISHRPRLVDGHLQPHAAMGLAILCGTVLALYLLRKKQ